MRVTIWGARGSVATAGPEFARFGGNTTCVEIEAAGDRLIIDAGTGIRVLGGKLAREARSLGRPVRATILFTHLHWDHVQGFPFFGPAFAPDTELDLFGPSEAAPEGSLEAVLRRQMSPPTFPVTLEATTAHKRFHTIASGDELRVGDLCVRARALSHPQGSLGYRVEHGGRSLCFATDTEHWEGGAVDDALLDLARDVDLLVYDAQYTEAEYEGRAGCGPSRRGWGHSTHVAGARVARATGAGRLVLTHHDPGHDDAMIEAIERDARALFPACRAAREALPMAV
jgi:phosphoribosyl 1,2-cyclic phosphodiesterase